MALDDNRILFVRYSKTARILSTPVPIEPAQGDLFPELVPQHGFQFQGPFPINAASMTALLIYVRSAGRRPLSAAALAKVFGPEHEDARLLVSELYSGAMRGQRRSQFPRVATFYEEWDRLFGVVYGAKLDKAEKAAEETAKLYNLPAGIRLKPLLFGIGSYTFARYRVVWKRMAARMAAVVLTTWKTPFGTKPLIATDTISLITAKTLDEAHYLCAILNSRTVDEFIRSFSSGGRGFGAPSVVKNLAIPLFDERRRTHRKLAELSRSAHESVDRGREISNIEDKINSVIEELWTLKR